MKITKSCKNCSNDFLVKRSEDYRLYCSNKCYIANRFSQANRLDFLMSSIKKLPDNGCWIWVTEEGSNKYARVSWNGRVQVAHRIFFTVLVGEIPEDKLVLHKCDVKACVNPDHLYLGNYSDNMQDALERKRRRLCELSPSSKLSNKQVREITELRNAGESVKSLCERFKVHKNTVWMITSRRTWRFLQLADE